MILITGIHLVGIHLRRSNVKVQYYYQFCEILRGSVIVLHTDFGMSLMVTDSITYVHNGLLISARCYGF